MKVDGEQTMLPARRPNWPERARKLREEEWEAHKECLRAARHALKTVRGRKYTIAEIAKLLDLASKLGRLATGMATDHVEHAFSQYHDAGWMAVIDKQLDVVFGKPIDIEGEVTEVRDGKGEGVEGLKS